MCSSDLPKYEVFIFRLFRVKLIYIALFFMFFEYIRLANIDGTSHFAHFGGVIWALVLVNNLKKGRDFSKWMENFMSLSFLKRKKIKIVYKSTKKKQQPKTTSSDTKIRQEKVDAILDKIKASGYDSLTKDEKDYLFNASKNI